MSCPYMLDMRDIYRSASLSSLSQVSLAVTAPSSPGPYAPGGSLNILDREMNCAVVLLYPLSISASSTFREFHLT